jgi:hypothetical protein
MEMGGQLREAAKVDSTPDCYGSALGSNPASLKNTKLATLQQYRIIRNDPRFEGQQKRPT